MQQWHFFRKNVAQGSLSSLAAFPPPYVLGSAAQENSDYLVCGAARARAALAEKTQAWSRLRSPNFIVVTNASEKQARRVAYQFEMIRAVFRRFFNVQGSAPDPPVIIIAAKDEATLKPLLPENYQGKGSVHPSGLYLGGPEKNYVALRLDVSLNQEAYEAFEPMYHEYVHYLTRRWISQLPLWLTEGLAEFYGNTRLESKTICVGAPSSSNLIVLHQNQLLPLGTLFAVNASSPYYHENNKASIFYAESWALTHYLMTRDWRENTNRLSQFVVLMGQNATPEDAAKRTIGDPETLEGALRRYIGSFTFTAARLAAPSEVDEGTFAPEAISEAESLAVRGDFLVHTRRYAEARQMLEESLKSDPKLAAAYESMGLLYAEQNKTDEANKWYSQAVALNSQSYLANFYYATNLLKPVFTMESECRMTCKLLDANEVGDAQGINVLDTYHKEAVADRIGNAHNSLLIVCTFAKYLWVGGLLMKRSASYTMRDVARLARVSVTTVSSIVNGRGGVRPEVVGRVDDAIATLDYHPNEVARLQS